MVQPQTQLESVNQISLLIVADRSSDVTTVVQILKTATIIFSYEVVSQAEAKKSMALNSYDVIVWIYVPPRLPEVKISSPAESTWWHQTQSKTPLILVGESPETPVVQELWGANISCCLLFNNLKNLPHVIQELVCTPQQLQQQNILSESIKWMVKSQNLEEFLIKIISLLETTFDSMRCLIFYAPEIQTNRNWCVISQKAIDRQIIGFWEQIARENHNLLIQGELVDGSMTEQSQPERSLLIVPCLSQDKYLGGICIDYCSCPYHWQAEELNLFKSIANLCAIAINNHYISQHLETEFQQGNPKPEALDTAKLELFSHLTHELRTPLTAILGFATMLREQIYGNLNGKQIQYVKAIHDSGEHLLALINDLLDMSKIEAEREELFVERIAVEDVCLAAMSMVKALASQQGLKLNLEIQPDVSFCHGDKRRLKQILINLLSNGIKFTEAGLVTLRVELQEDTIKFMVIDTGIGISASDREKLFQPFSQLKTHLHRHQRGTGLGLALSRKLARLHGGDLTLTSEVGKGSCFTLHLPL